MVNSTPKYDGLIFDLDGTLWDAARASAIGWNNALRKLGLGDHLVSAGDIRAVSGRPFADGIKQVLQGALVSSDACGVIDAHERESIEAYGGVVYDGVIGGVRLLSNQCRLFLVSNCQSWYLEAFWSQIGLKRYFSDWDCHGSAEISKSAMIDKILRKHGLLEAIYIGDTEWDEEAAHDVGIDFGYVSYGFGSAQAPAVSFSSFRELVGSLSEGTKAHVK